MERVSRRGFLRAVALAVSTGALVTLRSLTDRLAAITRSSRTVAVPADLLQDVTFVEDVIVCRGATGDVHAFSARCTHLGCRISQHTDGLLVCPCHGSRFRTDGTVARGPAARPLEPLAYRIDPNSGAVLVQTS